MGFLEVYDVRGDISASCDCRYELSADHNYEFELKASLIAELVSTGHDYIYSLSVGFDFRSGLTAGNDFSYGYRYVLSADQDGIAGLIAMNDCGIVLSTGQDVRAASYKLCL
jgi:hypothetical protein